MYGYIFLQLVSVSLCVSMRKMNSNFWLQEWSQIMLEDIHLPSLENDFTRCFLQENFALYSFNYSFNKSLLSTYNTPETALHTAVNKIPPLKELRVWCGNAAKRVSQM